MLAMSPDPLLDTIAQAVDLLARIVRADHAWLQWAVDGETRIQLRRWPPQVATPWEADARAVGERASATGRALATRLKWPSAVLSGAPLRLSAAVTGWVVVAHTERATLPTGAELDLLGGAVEMVDLVVQTALQGEEARRSRELADRLQEASRAISDAMSLPGMLEAILTQLNGIVPYDSASVQELRGGRMVIIGSHGFPNSCEIVGVSFDLGARNPNRDVVARREPVIVDDAPARYPDFASEPHARAYIRSFLGVPLIFRNRLIGMISIDKREPGFFKQAHARAAMAFATHAAVAIENARLYRSLQTKVTERTEAEHAARERERRLAEAQRIAHIGTWEWDVASDLLWGSDEVYRILGTPPEEMGSSRKTIFDRIHPDDRPAVAAARQAALAGKRGYSARFRLLRPDGTARLVHSRGELMRDESGSSVRMLGTVQDITEACEVEETLALMSSALRETADQVFITDKSGRFQYVNPAFERHTGFNASEVEGCTPRVLKSGQHSPSFHSEVWKALVRGEVVRTVFVNRKRNGELYQEEKTITPVRGAKGEITHFVSVGRDVTERVRAEEEQARLQRAVSRSAYEWRATFDAVNSPLLLVGRDGRVLRPNRAVRDLSGKPYREIMGISVRKIGPSPLWVACGRLARRALCDKATIAERVADRRTGRTWDLEASPVRVPGTGPTGSIVLARDVTRLVELQESLRRSETMSAMGRLVAGVAHEVRNPLFGISATLDALDVELGDTAGYREYGRRLQEEVDRLNDLMRDLLEYGRPAPAELARRSLCELLQGAVRQCEKGAAAAGVRVRRQGLSNLPALDVDGHRLAQVFQNLIWNAIQHSPPGGAVTLRARVARGGQAVQVHIEDEGPGFREEDLGRVFEPFFTRRRGGTGLGLAIAQRIAEDHGGGIAVANRPTGGAVVTVSLPCSRRAVSPVRSGDRAGARPSRP